MIYIIIDTTTGSEISEHTSLASALCGYDVLTASGGIYEIRNALGELIQQANVVQKKARLTYHYAPACIISGVMVRNCWYTVYDRSGRIVIETACEDEANQAAEQFTEISYAEREGAS